MTSNASRRDIALVTGANRGLGLETCRQLVRHGLRVLLTARDPESGRRAAEALRQESLDVQFLPLDVTDRASIDALARELERQDLTLDVLVNNAGIALNGFNAEVARRTVDANFYGPMHLTDRLLPLMTTRGRIVMVSSGIGELEGLPAALRRRFEAPDLDRATLSGLVEAFVEDVAKGIYARNGWPGSGYRVSKIALNALTRILARDLGPGGVRVNAVCPGWVQTRMGGSSAPLSTAEGVDTIVWAAMFSPDGPTGRWFRERREIPW